MLNGVGTNISMAYTSNYNKKSTGDKTDIEFEIGNSEQNSLNKCGERQSELTEIYMMITMDWIMCWWEIITCRC